LDLASSLRREGDCGIGGLMSKLRSAMGANCPEMVAGEGGYAADPGVAELGVLGRSDAAAGASLQSATRMPVLD
jgi:hypothetical protein